jgi:hypothetical protein
MNGLVVECKNGFKEDIKVSIRIIRIRQKSLKFPSFAFESSRFLSSDGGRGILDTWLSIGPSLEPSSNPPALDTITFSVGIFKSVERLEKKKQKRNDDICSHNWFIRYPYSREGNHSRTDRNQDGLGALSSAKKKIMLISMRCPGRKQ